MLDMTMLKSGLAVTMFSIGFARSVALPPPPPSPPADPLITVITAITQAEQSYQKGGRDQTNEYIQTAKKLLVKHSIARVDLEVRVLQLEGNLLYDNCRLTESLNVLLKVQRLIKSNQHIQVAYYQNNLLTLGVIFKALDCRQEGLELIRKASEGTKLGTNSVSPIRLALEDQLMMELAAVHPHQGILQIESILEHRAGHFGRESEPYVSALLARVEARLELGLPKLALQDALTAASIQEKVGKERHSVNKHMPNYWLGMCYLRNGDLWHAERQCLTLIRELDTLDASDWIVRFVQAKACRLIAEIYEEGDQKSEALAAYQRTLELMESIPLFAGTNHERLDDVARILSHVGDHEAAECRRAESQEAKARAVARKARFQSIYQKHRDLFY